MQDGIEVVDQWAKKGREVGKQWLFRVWDPDRRAWKSMAFAKKNPGWTWAEGKRAQFNRGEAAAGKIAFAMVMRDYLDELERRGQNERYRAEVERVCQAVIDAGGTDVQADDFARVVTRWLASAPSFVEGRADPGHVTKNRWLIELRSVCKHAVMRYGVRLNPLRDVKPFKVDKKVKPIMRLDELRAMVAPAMEGDWYFTQAAMLIYTGMRRDEVAHVRKEWIDREARTITLHVIRDAKGAVEWAPKGNKERIVPLQRELDELLTRLVPNLSDAGWLIADERARTFDDRNAWEAFRAYIDRAMAKEDHAKTRNLHPHCTRHTWTALQLASGQSPSAVRRALGHASLTTTDGYANAESAYTAAVRGWHRGEFQLRPPAIAKPSGDGPDLFADVRARLEAGATVAAIAGDARVPAELLESWLRNGPPPMLRQYAAVIAACRVGKSAAPIEEPAKGGR